MKIFDDDEADRAKKREMERAWREHIALPGVRRRSWLFRHLLAQESRCFYCNAIIMPNHSSRRKRATLDHFIPLGQGGPDSFENCVAACQHCNEQKADNLWEKDCMRRSRRGELRPTDEAADV
jgi:5-methylcytosine-specific restriction endonuclease McrA